jgi:glycolate oxidase
MIQDGAYKALEEAVGQENASREPAVLDGYAWQPTMNDDPAKWVQRPAAAVLPASTEEVQEVVRACNRHGLKFKAFSTGWGVYSGPTCEGVVQIDLRRMDRILEIDEKNMYAVVEPYVNGAQLQAESMKVGLNTHIIGAGPACSPLASATSMAGVGWDGIYMSYSARNVLGAEWVLPDGEVLRLGTLGSDAGWFCGDGPGPSLRGLMRGSMGALGGLGVFTRCALKLFNWPGPPQMETEGLLLNVRSRIPDNFRFYSCIFPDKGSLADATYKIGDSEIGYLATRTSVPAFISVTAPGLLEKIARTRAIRDIASKSMKWALFIVLAGHSGGEIEHQQKVLEEIVLQYKGIAIDMMAFPQLRDVAYVNFIRVTAIPLVFRMGGLFATALGRNETWDMQLDWAQTGEEIKMPWIERDGIMNDLGDNPFMALYENNTWSHCEEIYQYNARDRKHLESLEPLLMEFFVAAVERSMEPFSSTDARLRSILGPMLGHYNIWQKRISQALDENGAADTGMYCDEWSFDFSKVNPELKRKLDTLIDKFNWTESGPPE